MKKAITITFSLFIIYAALTGCLHAMNQNQTALDQSQLQLQNKNDNRQEIFQAQFASQQLVDGENAIAVTFSTALETTQNLDSYFSIFTKEGVAVEGGWILSEDPEVACFINIEPDTNYNITIHKGLKARSSSSGIVTQLTQQAKFQVKTRPVETMINFGSKGFILASTLARGLPVSSVNIDQADIDFFRIKELFINDFFSEFGKQSNIAYYMSDELNQYADLVYSGRWDLDIKKDIRTNINIPITHISQLKEPGVYVAVLKGAGRYDYRYSSTWFTISDLGLHVRKYANGLQVQVQSLETAQPVSGVQIEAYNAKGIRLMQMKTDGKGTAYMRGAFQDLHFMTARNNRHITLLLMDVPAMDLSEFKTATESLRPVDLFVYGPRDLYRPGETIVFDGLLRKHDGRMTAGLPIKAGIYRPDGRIVHEFIWKNRHLNYYHHEYSLPADALTGTWRIDFEHAGHSLKPYEFTVAEFLPERMKLTMDNPECREGIKNQEVTAGQGESESQGDAEGQGDIKSQGDAEGQKDTKCQGNILGKTDSLIIALKGDYLYGAPASGSRVDAQIRLKPARKLFPDLWPGYEFGDATEAFYRSFQTDKIFLDQQGRGFIKVKNQWESMKSPAWITANGSLYESGGRPVVRSRSWQVWPAGVLVGIRSLANDGQVGGQVKEETGEYHVKDQVKSNSVAEFEIIAVNTEGRRISAGDLKAVVIREHRDYYWEYKNGAWQWQFTRQFYPQERFSIDISEDAATLVQVPVEWGGYRLEITNPATGLLTSYRIWAGWRYTSGGWSDGGDQGGNRPDRVDLILDKPRYRPGDTAKVMVKAPEGGSGYLFVESDTNLLTKPITIPAEGSTVEIEIDHSWQRHDLYISAIIVRPGEVKIEALPKRSVGLIHLPLERIDRHFSLEISLPDKIEPDQFIEVPVIVRNSDASPLNLREKQDVWVSIAAVDVGVLNLTGFETPSPWNYFFQPRRYAVELHDLYQKLIEAGEGAWAAQRFGGDAPKLSRGGDRPSTDVQIVSLYKEAVQVDDDGIARFRLNIPDFNGAVRFMAVAHGAESFGAADKEVIIAAPMVAQIAMPRFLSMGDRSQLMLDLHNLSGISQEVDLTIETTSPIKTVGTTHRHLMLKDKGRIETLVPLFAEQKLGRSDITCTIDGLMVDGKKRTMVKKWFLETRPAYPAFTTTWRKALKPGEHFSIGQGAAAFNDLIDDTITVEAGLSATPPVNISEHVRFLNAYPYGCLEQTTSGIYPHVILSSSDFAALGITSQSDRERTKKVILGIQRLMEKQKTNGGFGLWSGHSAEDFWLTAYVTDFLLNAREAGYEVPVGPLSKALDRLLHYVRRGGTVKAKARYYDEQAHYPAAVRAYAAMVLARVQSLTLGDARSVYRAVKDNIKGALGLVQAGIALHLSGDHSLAVEAFDKALQTRRKNGIYYGDYGSNLRDFAFAFHLLSTHCPDYGQQNGKQNQKLNQKQNQKQNRSVGQNRDAFEFLFKLNSELKQRKWLSTQERNSLVMAGASAMQNRSSVWQTEVTLGGKTFDMKGDGLRQIASTGKNGDSALGLENPGQGSRGFKISNTGDIRLFIDVAMNGYPAEKPDVESRGASIQRRYLNMEGEELPASIFHIDPLQSDVLRSDVLQSDMLQSDMLQSDMLQSGSVSADALQPLSQQSQDIPSGNLRTGQRMIIELQFKADERLPNALLVDLLPACLELEDPSFEGSSSIGDVMVKGKRIAKWHENFVIRHTEYRDDRFMAALDIKGDTVYRLFYPVRVVTPGEFLVPPPLIEDMYRPYIRGVGDAVPLMPVHQH